MHIPEAENYLHKRQVQVRDQQVTYKVAGSGEPVILVHGLAGSTRWWANTIPALAASYRVYLVDLPGFGSMRHYPGGFVLKDAAAWLRDWMLSLDLPDVHLVGHSMGGYISLRLAAHSPQMVKSLMLIDPAGVPTSRSTLGHFLPLVQESLLASPAFLLLLLRDSLRSGPGTLWRTARALLAEDVRHDLRAIQAPTLLIWGEKDALVPASLGYVLHEEIPGSRLVIIEGSRHVPMIDNPQRLNRELLRFLSDLTAPRWRSCP